MNSTKKSDFTRNDLPKNRTEVFFDCIKVRFLTLFGAGLIILVGFLPIIFVTFLKDSATIDLYYFFENGLVTKSEYAQKAYANDFIFSLAFVPCYIILSVAVAGVMKIIRRLAFSEPLFFKQDFFDGVKDNSAQTAVIALIGGLLSVLLGAATPVDRTQTIIIVAAKGLAVLTVAPIFLYALSEITVYKLKITKQLKNAALLYIKTAPRTLIFLAVFVAPYFLSLINNLLVKYIALIVFVILAAPLILTAWFLFCCSTFDKYINKENFPDLFDKGVYR